MINFSGRFRGVALRLAAIAAAITLGCGGARPIDGDREGLGTAPEGRLWVLAPHPDDEVLMAGELMRAAIARGRPLSVLVMTNGDLSCARDGHARQAETIAALAVLGVTERDVRFLGYPDGWLDALGPEPFPPVPRTQPDGSCGTGDRTYASRGAGGIDVHTARTGSPGAYVASGPVDDLARLLERERPTDVVTAHGIDTHPDHAMTYAYLRRAIERAGIAPPRILRSIVHQGACWPNGAGVEPCPPVPTTRGTPFPALGPPLDAYLPTLRIASPDGGDAKRAAIARYTTQLGAALADESWLSSFARTDETFFDETLVADPEHAGWLVHAGAGSTAQGAIEASFETESRLEVGTVVLTIDARGATLREGERMLRELPIPHGESPSTTHAWDVRFDPRADHPGLAEVTVRRDGEVWMLAIVSAAQPRSVVPPQSSVLSRPR